MSEFKIRTVRPWSDNPVFEVLISERAGKGWFSLQTHDGKPARFNKPPSSLEEAEDAIRAHKDQADGANGTDRTGTLV